MRSPSRLLLLLLAAAASPSAQQMQDAQRAHVADLAAQAAAQAQAEQAAAEAQRVAAEHVAAASRLRLAEDALAAALQRADDLARRRDAARLQASADERALAPMLPLLERLSLFPAETLLAAPGSPEDAVRGALVLGGLVRQLRARAAALAAERAAVGRLQDQLDAALPALRAAEQAQRAQAAALDAALSRAQLAGQAAQGEAADAARRAAADAARADSLRAAIAALNAARAAEARRAALRAAAAARRSARQPAARPAAAPAVPRAEVAGDAAAMPAAPASRGGWATPVAGRVVRAYGAVGDAGPADGITIQTPPGARVVSPCAGRVVFAAPFRSYGRLAIVDCGSDAHLVLAGLGRLDAVAGQAVHAGEPLGVMTDGPGAALYLELRHGSRTVDPSMYLHGGL